jgi:hypothetical protein
MGVIRNHLDVGKHTHFALPFQTLICVRLHSFYTFVTPLSMSEISRHRPPFSPSKAPILNLQYDEAGNPYHQDEFGRWVPHIGFAQVCQTVFSSSVLYSD